MLPAVSSVPYSPLLGSDSGEVASTSRRLDMSADLEAVSSALEVPLGVGEKVFSSSYQARLYSHEVRSKGLRKPPEYRASMRKFDPNARSRLAEGRLTELHLDPQLRAAQYVACRIPNTFDNPSNPYSQYLFRCASYYKGTDPFWDYVAQHQASPGRPPLVMTESGRIKERGCCVML